MSYLRNAGPLDIATHPAHNLHPVESAHTPILAILLCEQKRIDIRPNTIERLKGGLEPSVHKRAYSQPGWARVHIPPDMLGLLNVILIILLSCT
jgi:hypothetical protein